MEDRWPQRCLFRAKLDAYKKANSFTSDQVAEMIGLTPKTFGQYLYNTKTKPSIEVLQASAKLFGCSVTEFIDDTHSELPGVQSDDMARLSEAKRAVMHMVFQNLKPEDVSDEQALQYLKIIEAAVAAGRIRKPQWD